MTADTLIRYITWFVFVAIFVRAIVDAVRDPRRATVDTAVFFAAPMLIIMSAVLAELGLLQPNRLTNAITGTLLLSIAYWLFRLVDDFAPVPRWAMWLTGALWVALSAGFFAFTPPRPLWLTIAQVLYFVGLQLIAAVAFVRASRRASGVTRRRMLAVATGSLLLGLTILFASLQSLGAIWAVASESAGLAAGLSYFFGFATPLVLRRAWQEPELRAFLSRAASLPRLPTTAAIIESLEQGAATSVGAPHASIGLIDPETNMLNFRVGGDIQSFPLSDEVPAGRAILTQRPLFVANMVRVAPQYADDLRASGAVAMLFAPITAGDKHIGVLTVYARRAPIFARDDLELVRLLADQAAVILESRSLIDEAARVQAREEATRLKDDFLSAAAHDLKTPLTTLMVRAQLMERRALRDPHAPADIDSIRMIMRETQRLRTLVLDLLDAARAEQGKLVGAREPVDLTAVAEEMIGRFQSARHPIELQTDGPLIGLYDRNRICQLLENLLENAVKYSPEAGPIRVDVKREDQSAHLAVTDRGIGIPAGDLPHIFDRFHRGTNVDDRRFAGMGLGLYICRGIAEQHGGRIAATSRPGEGTTFHITLPLDQPGVTDARSPDPGR